MITSHTTFVLLAERRAPARPGGDLPVRTTRSATLPRRALATLAGLAGLRRNVSPTGVDPAPARSS